MIYTVFSTQGGKEDQNSCIYHYRGWRRAWHLVEATDLYIVRKAQLRMYSLLLLEALRGKSLHCYGPFECIASYPILQVEIVKFDQKNVHFERNKQKNAVARTLFNNSSLHGFLEQPFYNVSNSKRYLSQIMSLILLTVQSPMVQ